MGLLSNGNITLIDLTDNRSATLYLTTSLSKTQIETGNAKFEPDYSIAGGQVITPSLFFGSEAFNGEYNVSYNINGKSIAEYAEDYGFSQEGNVLYIRKNLIEASYFISAIIETPIKDPVTKIEYTNIQAQLELTKLHNAEENYLPLISYNRDIFTDKNPSEIVLTANLYKGGSKYEENDIQYEWTSLNDDFNTILSTDKRYTVKRENIVNVSNYVCKMTVNNNPYTAQVTIRDLTDPLFSEIISSHGLYTMDLKEEIILTCNVYLGADSYEDVTYQWYTQEENGAEFTQIDGEKSKQYKFTPAQTGTYSYQCRAARIDKKGETIAQITIAASPEYKVEMNPKEIFIACDKDGNIKLEEGKIKFEGTINFKLIDHNGREIVFGDGEGIDLDELKANFNNLFKIDVEEDFSLELSSNQINFSINPVNITQNYYSINIPYTYLGIELNEEFYLIKNIQGEPGAAAVYNYITTSSSIVKKTIENNNKEYSPNSLTFSAWSIIGDKEAQSKSVSWRYYIDNNFESSGSSSGETLVLNLGEGNNFITPESTIRVEALINDKVFDLDTVEVLSEEQNLVISLDEDLISIPTNSEGEYSSDKIYSTNFNIYYGLTEVTQSASIVLDVSSADLVYERENNQIQIIEMPSDSDEETIIIKATYAGLEVSKTLRIIKVKNGTNGSPGAPAVYSYISSPASVIIKTLTDENGEKSYTYSPAELIINAYTVTGSSTSSSPVYWFYKKDDDSENTSFGDDESGSNFCSLNISDLKPESKIIIEAYQNKNDTSTLIDSKTFEIISDEKQLTVSLTNDRVNIPCDANGDYDTNSLTDILLTSVQIYFGINNVTEIEKNINISLESKTNIDCYIGDGTENKPKNSIFFTSISADKAYFDIKVKYAGKEITKRCEVVKIKQGDMGEPGTPGRGIERIEEYYKVTSNNISPEVDDSWVLGDKNLTIESLTSGGNTLYLWSYTKTIYSTYTEENKDYIISAPLLFGKFDNNIFTISEKEPENPLDKTIWLNSSVSPNVFKQYINGRWAIINYLTEVNEKINYIDIKDDGVYIKDNSGTSTMKLTSQSVTIGNVVEVERGFSELTATYVMFGNYQIRRTADGGLAFRIVKN